MNDMIGISPSPSSVETANIRANRKTEPMFESVKTGAFVDELDENLSSVNSGDLSLLNLPGSTDTTE